MYIHEVICLTYSYTLESSSKGLFVKKLHP